jgi:class 3 adenylate cyclase/tetratricopeptide (TPR) repeat protein
MTSCAACGAQNRAGARFCDACGAALAAPVPREVRKTVSVLFCDVTGSTEVAERLDPESFRRLLARYFDESRGAIERHGGTVEKFIGDAVMAVFGVPVVHEDDAVRAVRAAAELRGGLERLNEGLSRDFGATLELRIGITTGEVVTGTEERLATGDAVNVAARLQSAAAPGEILLDAETLALARDAVRVEELEPLDLKGKSKPVPAFRVVGIEVDAPGHARQLDAPLIGRSRELRLLTDAFEKASGGRSCELVTVLGAAGVGKSRLTREFLANVDARVVAGRCLSYGEGVTYWPVVEIVKQLEDLAEPMRAAGSPAAAAIGALLGEGQAATPGEIVWAARKLLETAAAHRPLVAVFDDVQWGEPAFLDLIEHLADLSRNTPILLLCLSRPDLLDLRPSWGAGKSNATTVLLEPLDAAEADELITQLLGPADLDPELAERVRSAAEGNPLFLEEMVAMMRDSSDREIEVPATIKALLTARLEGLDVGERDVLERGSVEGQLFHRGAVETLSESPGAVVGRLVGLVRKDLVRPDRPQLAAEDAYRFRHLLIRDAAYEALPKATRADLHVRFAAWLEERGGDLVERDEIVGYHLEQAYRYLAELGPVAAEAEQLAAHAAALLESSGHRARFRGDTYAASGLLARAAELNPKRQLEIAPELAEALLAAGELTRAAALLDEAVAAATSAGNAAARATAAIWRAHVGNNLGESTSQRVQELADEAVPLLEHAESDGRLAGVLYLAGVHRFWAGRARDGEQMLRRAFALALRVDDLPRAQECLAWSRAAMLWGPAPASELRAELEETPPELRGTLTNRGWHLIWGAWTDGFAGEFDQARGKVAEVNANFEEVGAWALRGTNAINAGGIELLANDLESAQRVLRDGYERLGALGEVGFRVTVATMLGDVLQRLGRDVEADEILLEAAEASAADDVDPHVRWRAARAQILARRGELDGALGLATQAIGLATATDYLVLTGDALLALANVLEAREEHSEAEARRREALDLYERKESLPQVAQVRRLLAASQ